MWKSSRLLLLKISGYAIGIATLIITTIGALSLYGSNISNIYIKIGNNNYGMSLYKTEDFSDATTNLVFSGMTDMTNSTMSDIPTTIGDTVGDESNYVRKSYLAYTFYLKNRSVVDVTYDMTFDIVADTKGVSSAVRVKIIKDGAVSIYAKAKEVPFEEVGQPEDHPYLTTQFYSPTIVARETGSPLNREQYTKYTVIIWLEGYDEQCINSIMGGKYRMEMNFSVNIPT